MSEPTNDLSMEIMSAISSLNMYPQEHDVLDPNKYMSELYWCAHAMEHLQQAITLAAPLQEKVRMLEEQLEFVQEDLVAANATIKSVKQNTLDLMMKHYKG